jgi:hypothetical protein
MAATPKLEGPGQAAVLRRVRGAATVARPGAMAAFAGRRLARLEWIDSKSRRSTPEAAADAVLPTRWQAFGNPTTGS